VVGRGRFVFGLVFGGPFGDTGGGARSAILIPRPQGAGLFQGWGAEISKAEGWGEKTRPFHARFWQGLLFGGVFLHEFGFSGARENQGGSRLDSASGKFPREGGGKPKGGCCRFAGGLKGAGCWKGGAKPRRPTAFSPTEGQKGHKRAGRRRGAKPFSKAETGGGKGFDVSRPLGGRAVL